MAFDFTPPDFSQSITVPQEPASTPFLLKPVAAPKFDFTPPKFDFTPPSFETKPLEAPKFDFTPPSFGATTPKTSPVDKTPWGFGKNLIEDATSTLKGIGNLLFVDVPTAAYAPIRATYDEKYRNEKLDTIKKWMDDPAATVSGGFSHLWHAVTQPYVIQEGAHKGEFNWDFWYDHPFSVAADIATIASFGAGGAAKMATAAERAATAARAVGEVAKAAELTQKAEQWTKIASTIDKGGKIVDPFAHIERAVKGVASPIAAHFGIGAESKNINNIIAETRAEALEEMGRAEKLGLKPEDLANLEEIVPVKGGVKVEEMRPKPLFEPIPGSEAVRHVPGVQELHPETIMEEVKAKPVLGVQTPEEAADLLKRAQDQVRERLTLKDTLGRLTKGELPDHPVIQDRVRDTLLDLKWKKIQLDRVNEFLNSKNLLKTVRGVGEGDWVPIDVNGFREMLDKDKQITKVFSNAYNEAIKAGNPRALDAAGQAVKDFTANYGAVRSTLPAETLYAPKYIANYLKLQFAPKAPGFFPNVLKYWSPTVTTFRFPIYQLQVLGGNRFMSLLAGGEWGLAKRLSDDGFRWPAELSKEHPIFRELEEWASGEQAYGTLRQKYLDLAKRWAEKGPFGLKGLATAGSDTELRQAIASGFITRELEKTLNASFKTEAALTQALKDVLSSKTDFRALTPELMAINAEIAEISAKRAAAGHFPELTKTLDDRLSGLYERRNEISKVGKNVELLNKAIDEGNRWTGSVLHLSPFERNKLMRIVPFYSYTKAMTALAFRMPFLYPGRYFMLSRLHNVTNEIMHDNRNPEWVDDYMPMGFTSDGSIVAIRTGSLNPFGGVRGMDIGELGVPALVDPTRNPIFKLGYDLLGGVPTWSKKPLSPGEMAVRYGDGSVYQYQKDGSFKKVLSQPNVLRLALNLNPFTQAVTDLTEPWFRGEERGVRDDRGHLILGPDGKPRFPKEWYQDLLGVGGFKLTSYNTEQMQLLEKKKYIGILKDVIKEIKKERDPEQRQDLIDMVQDAQQQQNMKVKR